MYGKTYAAADSHSVIQGDDYRFTVLNKYRAQILFVTKEKVYKLMQSKDLVARKISMIEAIPMHEGMKSVLMELLLAEN